jgi:hypothetical protein
MNLIFVEILALLSVLELLAITCSRKNNLLQLWNSMNLIFVEILALFSVLELLAITCSRKNNLLQFWNSMNLIFVEILALLSVRELLAITCSRILLAITSSHWFIFVSTSFVDDLPNGQLGTNFLERVSHVLLS